MTSFKENLRNELDFQGLTVKELSARTGIIKGTLDNYLGARASIPPADIAVKIADALHVSVEYLVKGEDRKIRMESMSEVAVTPESRMILRDLKAVPSNIKESLATLIHQTAVMFARKTQDD